MKKTLILLISLFILFGICSCQNKSGKTVVLVTDESGLKDGYYNQLTYNGLKKAASEYGFNLVVETAKSASDYDSVLKAAVELTPDLIVISNPDMESEAVAYAKNYASLNFIFVECNGDLNLDGYQDSNNIYSIRFDQSEEGFLSGIAAASIATDHVAFVGTNEFNTYIEYESGFRAGVKTINPNTTVDVTYIKESDDTQSVHDQVSQMIQNGVQAIYTLNENEGLYQAAQDYGIPVIIADYNYKDKLKNGSKSIVFVVDKKIDQAVYLVVSDYFNGLYKGQIKKFAYSDECLSYEVLNHSTINSDTESTLNAWVTQLKNNAFSVPATRAAFNSFVPPQLPAQE